MSLRYEKLQPCHLQEVNTFLVENYFSKESVGLRLGIKPTNKDVNDWLSEVTKPILEQLVRIVIVKWIFNFQHHHLSF